MLVYCIQCLHYSYLFAATGLNRDRYVVSDGGSRNPFVPSATLFEFMCTDPSLSQWEVVVLCCVCFTLDPQAKDEILVLVLRFFFVALPHTNKLCDC